MKKVYLFPLALVSVGSLTLSAQNISPNTTRNPNSTLSMLEVLQISAAANTKGLYISHSAAASPGYGLWVDAANKYAIVIPSGGGNVGIGTIAPGAKLGFNDLNDGTNGADGITWYNPSPTAYGIFRSAGAWSAPNYQQLNLAWQTGIVIDGGSLYGRSGTTLQPTAGNVGIGTGTALPSAKLQVIGKTSLSSDGTVECCGNDATLTLGENRASSGLFASISFHNGGFDEGTFQLTSGGLGVAGNSRRFKMFDNQGVYMGLELTGKLFFGNGGSRTETLNDAGLDGGTGGAQSGFFETSAPSPAANLPVGGSSWWHLMQARHSNNGNNFAMQIAGGFWGTDLYYRLTGNNAAAPWYRILSSANYPVSVSLASDYAVTAAGWTTVAPMSVTFTATKSTALVQFTAAGFAYTNSMAYIQFRIWNSTTGASVGGTNTTMQSYDDMTGTITPWSCAFSKNITGLTAGTSYTLIVQAQRNGILGVYDAVIN